MKLKLTIAVTALAALCLTACSVSIAPGEPPPAIQATEIIAETNSPGEPSPAVQSPEIKAKTETPGPSPTEGLLYEAGYFNVTSDWDGITVTRCEDTGAGIFVFTVTGYKDADGYYPYHANKLTVKDARTGALVSAFDVDTTCKLSELGLTIADLNYDGAQDIMLYADVGGAHENVYYLAYLWDSRQNAFVPNGSFSEICNATVDPLRQAILEIASDSAFSMWYAIYRYQGGAFVKEAGLREEEEIDGEYTNYTEYRYPNGVETVAKTGRYPTEHEILTDGTTPNHEHGSYWDLFNPIWYSGDHYAEGDAEAPGETLSGSDKEAMDLSVKVLALLKNKDWNGLSAMVHSEQGLTFSPYGFVDTETAVRLTSSEVKSLGNDNKTRVWGTFPSGDPIEYPFDTYYSRFIFDRDFTAAPETAVNRVFRSELESNLYVLGNGVVYTDFYFPGTGPDADYNWASLRLVFGGYEGKPYLVGVVHEQWTP